MAELVPWVEKYRPRTVSEVGGQDEVIKTLKQSMNMGNLPHLLFYGPPGTGKTSTILAVTRELFGPELIKSRVLELNASDERGINVVRHKVKNFAQTAVGSGVPGYPSPPFKVIILDEADSMTKDAQNALRRTMEAFSRVTRFCLICNYISRIIEPLASRCAKFRFQPLGSDALLHRVKFISQQEGIECSDQALETLVSLADGDLRKAITYLQSGTRLFGSILSPADLTDIAGVIPADTILALLDVCKSNSFDTLQQHVKQIILSGYSAIQAIHQLYERILSTSDISDLQKAQVVLRLSEAEKALVDGADEYLQLLDVTASIMRVFCSMAL